MSAVTHPTKLGGIISAFDSDSISAEIDVSGLPIGTKVFNQDVGSQFTLTLSDATLVPDVVLEVKGITGARWILDTSGGGGVVSVTGDGVDNADPANPVVDLTGVIVTDMFDPTAKAPDADHADDADTADAASTADSPTNATTFTAALDEATTAAKGLMSVSDKVKLNDLDYDGWFKTQVDIMHAQAPALTNFREMKLGDRPAGVSLGSASNDPNAVGGGISHGAGAKVTVGASIFQTTATTSWAFAWRCKMPAPSGANFYFAGLLNAGATHYCGVASYGTTDATHWQIYLYNGVTETIAATSNVADTNYHDFVMTFDGTTIKLYIDTVLRASTTTLTLTDEPMFACINGPGAGDVKALRFAYGYIAP